MSAAGILKARLGSRKPETAMILGSSLGSVADAVKDAANDKGYARRRFQRLVVPFAMPLLIGPGAISTIIIQAGEAEKVGPAGQAAGVVAIVAAGFATFVCFTLTGPISRLLGEIGMAIIVRVLGLILCALAIQFILARRRRPERC